MVKNSLSHTLVVVSYVLLLIILGLMAYYKYMILLPIYYLFINFVCKTMSSVILMLINFQSRIYLWGRSFYKGLCKYGVYPIPSPSSFHSSSTAYTTSSAPSSSTATIVSPSTSTQILLWHNRLGHPSSKILHFAIQFVNNFFTSNNVDDCCSSCTFCISVKMHRLSLSKHEISSASMFQIVHTDV